MMGASSIRSCSRIRPRTATPIIDVHMHALAADHQGPPPIAMCTPFRVPVWDPATPYGEVLMAAFKNPPCDDPIWSGPRPLSVAFV